MTPEISPTKVMIVDDHDLFADGLEQILTIEAGYEILAKINNGKLLMQTLNSQMPHLILLDIQMPVMDGLETALLIKQKYPKIKIVFVSMMYEQTIKTFIAQHNIDGFIIKQVGAPQLKEALKSIMQGNKAFIIPHEMEKAENKPSSLHTDFFNIYKLTKTEIDIIRLIAKGDSSKMIAAQKGLALVTVETHRKNIFRKLQVKNVAELVTFAVKHKLIE